MHSKKIRVWQTEMLYKPVVKLCKTQYSKIKRHDVSCIHHISSSSSPNALDSVGCLILQVLSSLNLRDYARPNDICEIPGTEHTWLLYWNCMAFPYIIRGVKVWITYYDNYIQLSISLCTIGNVNYMILYIMVLFRSCILIADGVSVFHPSYYTPWKMSMTWKLSIK